MFLWQRISKTNYRGKEWRFIKLLTNIEIECDRGSESYYEYLNLQHVVESHIEGCKYFCKEEDAIFYSRQLFNSIRSELLEYKYLNVTSYKEIIDNGQYRGVIGSFTINIKLEDEILNKVYHNIPVSIYLRSKVFEMNVEESTDCLQNDINDIKEQLSENSVIIASKGSEDWVNG